MNITVNLTPELRLEQALKNAGIDNPASVTKLAVTGTIGNNDFEYIRANMLKTLQKLDLKGVLIENNKIPDHAFYEPELRWGSHEQEGAPLTSVIIPDSVTEIGEIAFYGCVNLNSVNIPDSVVKIGHGAFADTGLTSVTIPDSVKIIDSSTFSGCQKLTSVTIPDSVVYIGWSAFEDCTGLKSVFIPAATVDIDDSAFNGCKAVITVHPDNPVYTTDKRGKLQPKAKNASGQIGDIEWSFSKGVLTISGDGEIPDYDEYCRGKYVTDENRLPWYYLRKSIKSVVINRVYHNIKGFRTFSGLRNLSSVTFKFPRIGEDSTYYSINHYIIDLVSKGYTHGDLCSIKNWFGEIMPCILDDFIRESACSGAAPGGMTWEEWEAILNRMSFCFSEMKESHYRILDDEYSAYYERMKKEGFELFFKWYEHLWF